MSGYYARQEAQANIGAELARRGWTIYGWKEDKTDFQTDYFDPERWEGVAEKDGAVVVIDKHDARQSGGVTRYGQEEAGICATCSGTGDCPGGWTYEKALEAPRAWHDHTHEDMPGAVSLFPDIVSPLPFGDYDPGAKCHWEKCHKCGGSGQTYRGTEYLEPWPTFQPNAKGTNWHVERDGVILARGQGAGRCRVDNRYSEAEQKELARVVGAFVDRLEAAANGGAGPRGPKARKAPAPAPAATEGATWRTNEERGAVEVAFASKPAKAVREALKAAGFRWYGVGGFWYAKDTAERRALLDRITGA